MSDSPAQGPYALETPEAGDQGRLSEHPLPALLLALHRTRFDGVLHLSREKTQKDITFLQGAPVMSGSNLPSETLGRQLIDQGIIDSDAHDRISHLMEKKGCKEGVALLALEFLKPKELFVALKEQIRRRLLESFAWADGKYELAAGGELQEEVQPLRTDVLALVHEGLANHWTPDRLLADLTPYVERFPVRSKRFDELMLRLPDGDGVTPLLDAIDGTRNLGSAIGAGFNDIRTLAAAWMLACGNFVSFEETAAEPMAEAGEDAEDEVLEIEVVTRGAAKAEARASTPGQSNANPAAELSDAARAMREEVLGLLEGLESRSLYEMLGVAEDAGDGEIRKAYFKAAKRFHPDALNYMGLAEIKDEAARVFARIAEANDVLRDAAKRADYDARQGSDEPMVDTHALAQAETFYRKGEILVKMGDWRGALEYLENAVEVYPDECEYQATLGWALFKQPKPNLERAVAHLERAIELDPEHPVALFHLGTTLRSAGDPARGDELIERARAIDPTLD